MGIVERWQDYINIEQLLELGLNKTQIANRLEISRTTLYKYLSMTPEEYQCWNEEMRTRSKKADAYEAEIISWLRASPDLSSAQVMDWLQERYGEIDICEGTIRNYVSEIREKCGIPKVKYHRQFEATEDPPMGKQTQVDFGEMKLQDEHNQWKTLRFIAFVLSHSRFKYVEWLDRPFTTKDVIASHERAFAYLGGMTKELVYDQDHLLVVSENNGEILFTQEFAAYRNERKFQIHLCRKQDPQSKGRIENVVKFVKYSFGRGRIYTNLSKLNESCIAWLARTGNGKLHHTTKKIPAEVHALEKQHLQPVALKTIETALSITRDIRKDNTVSYGSNRYSVPLGTYDSTVVKQAALRLTDAGEIIILDKQTGQEITRHPLCLDKGKLIKNTSHGRDRSKGVSAYLDHVAQLGPDPASFRPYLDEIRRIMPRYIRDQLQAIEKHIKAAPSSDIAEALALCTKNRLYGAQHFTDALKHFEHIRKNAIPSSSQIPVTRMEEATVNDRAASYPIRVPVRDINVYKRIMAGGLE
jgi:transposase